MWQEKEFREYVRYRIDKQFYSTAAEIALGSHYVDPMPGWRYDKLYSLAVDEIRLYKQYLAGDPIHGVKGPKYWEK